MIQLTTSYPQLGLTRAIPFILELHDPHTNKGTALHFICEQLGISPKNCIAFGDGENDVAMFKAAGYSVGMGNGMLKAKEAATHSTATNDEGGVGLFLNRVFR
jgi:hydroxymethylpyrimidine pyrophosphatase-like HAD family hydrolase